MARNTYKAIRPSFDEDKESSSDEDILGNSLRSRDEESDNDELSSYSFGALNNAQKQLQKGTKMHRNDDYDSDSESSDDEGFFEKEKPKKGPKGGKMTTKKRGKHAPTESSTKRPVSRIREIPGLPSNKESLLHTDIRFDAAYGKADLAKIRKNYAFLDEYRKDEITQMEAILKDKKKILSEREKDHMRQNMQSLKSRLDTMKNRDLETKILKEHKQGQIAKFKLGEQANPYFLKRSDKRKLIQKAKFDSMKNSQREKVMERKRKKRLGKEFRQLEFRKGGE